MKATTATAFFAGFTIMWEIHEEQNGLVLPHRLRGARPCLSRSSPVTSANLVKTSGYATGSRSRGSATTASRVNAAAERCGHGPSTSFEGDARTVQVPVRRGVGSDPEYGADARSLASV